MPIRITVHRRLSYFVALHTALSPHLLPGIALLPLLPKEVDILKHLWDTVSRSHDPTISGA